MSKKEQLSNIDTAWLRMDQPTNLMMITGVMMFAEPIPFERFKATLEERFLRFDRFRRRVRDRSGTPYWEDDPYFDLENHVHRIALPAPGDQRALQEYVSDLMGQSLDFSKPLWDMHLVENYGEGCAVITRIHHCIADGMALVRVLLEMTDETREGRRGKHKTRDHEAGRPGPVTKLLEPAASLFRTTLKATETVLHEGMNLVFKPSHLLARARQGLDLASVVAKLLLQGPDSDTIFKGELGVRKRAAWSQPVPLPLVKHIGKKMGGTINDVLLTAVAGALRRYLEAHDQPVDDVEIRAIVPVNLRPLDEPITLGNKFGLVFLTLPVFIADPLKRLREVHRRMEAIKGSMEAVVALGVLHGIGMAPKEIEKLVIKLFSRMGSAVMTNVPGPRKQLYFAGSPLTHIMFWVPRAGSVALGVSILSYNGEVLLGFATDAHIVPDPNLLTAAFHEEFDALTARFDDGDA
jgi:WS/DGAT/MGAT family acyltransferase